MVPRRQAASYTSPRTTQVLTNEQRGEVRGNEPSAGTRERLSRSSPPQSREVITTNGLSGSSPPTSSEVVTKSRRNALDHSRVVAASDSSRQGGTSQGRMEMMKEPITSRGRGKMSYDEPMSAFDVDRKPEAPTIRVTIGRIDVRGKPPARKNVQKRAARPRPQPALSLNDYLKQRTRGRR